MKTISVLLTKYSDYISTFLYYTGGRGYTHASIALEDQNENCYYSFNYRGFCVETIEKHKSRGVRKSVLYTLTVTDEAYKKIKRRLHFFGRHRNEFYYTRIGLAFCLFGIPFFWKNHYFCSQFVAELLQGADEIGLKRPSVLYLPCDLQRELEHNPYLQSVQYNVV